MNKREAAIVSCYTDKLIGSIDGICEYIEELVGRPIFTHEIPVLLFIHMERIKQDFISINVE